MADTHHTILDVPVQNPNPLPQEESPKVTREATAAVVEGLISQSLAKDDLLGRLCGSPVVAKIRRGGRR